MSGGGGGGGVGGGGGGGGHWSVGRNGLQALQPAAPRRLVFPRLVLFFWPQSDIINGENEKQ